MFSVWMGRRTLFYGAVALGLPFLLFCATPLVKNKTARKLLLSAIFTAYVCGMFCFTLAGRSTDQRQINLIPLWTYRYTSDPQYRWQGYMNVFLFLPFGFMLGFAAKRDFLQSLLIGFAFSVGIESAQYFFCLGMCEFDDVFHNSLGTALGYGYWKALSWVETKHGQDIRAAVHRAVLCARKLGAQGLAEIKSKIERGRK